MKNESLNRKDFFKKVSLFGISAIGASTLLKACGGGSEEAPAEEAFVDPCGDLTGLSDAEKQMRDSLGYIPQTEIPEQRCDNCMLWTVPQGDAFCGGCTIMAGPVHPAGWCNSWVAQA